MSKRQLLVPRGKVRDERTLITRINEGLSRYVASENKSLTDVQFMTSTEYFGLPQRDADTVYFVTAPEGIYVGDTKVAELSSNLFLGLYNQVGDNVTAGAGSGSPLLTAGNYNDGEYYVLDRAGVFSTSITELNGLTGATNDRIFAVGGTWYLVTATQDFLSSVVDDTAAGIITFTQPPVGSAAATAATELIRKGESDSGDATVQGNLDTHIADTDVHWSDVPNDDIAYVRRNKAWAENLNIARLGGTPDNFTLNTTAKKLENWSGSADSGVMSGSTDAIDGEITIPSTGVYRINHLVVGTQGNDTKEESMWSFLRITGGPNAGDYPLSVFDVATDKTDSRSLSGSFVRSLSSGEVLSLYMEASAGLGTFTFATTTFEVEILEGLTL